jgi:hypothetical protein
MTIDEATHLLATPLTLATPSSIIDHHHHQSQSSTLQYSTALLQKRRGENIHPLSEITNPKNMCKPDPPEDEGDDNAPIADTSGTVE